MLRKLRAWLANKLQPPTAPAPTAPTRRPLTISRRVLEDLKGQIAPVDGPRGTWRDYQFPELPPGVLPADEKTLALDEAAAPVTGEVRRTALALDSNSFAPQWGWLNGSNQYGCGLWFPGYPYLAELTQISEYRAPSETTSTEMTRKWFELQTKDGGDKSKKISEILARLDELKVRHLFRRAALLDGEFGRAQIYLNINDADDRARQLPLCITPEGIPKGSLKSIQCIEPYWSTPYSWNAAYPERADFYVPTSWYIMGRKTHATRLLTFIGREVPDILKPAYNFGGMSLTQLMEPYVNAWLRTRKAVNDLINNFSIPVLATNLGATLQEGGEPGSGLLARLQMFTLTRNNQAIAAINKDEEELKFAEATLASLDKLQAQSQEHMAAPAHVPLIKLFGVVPTGLNATGEGEIQVWYDWINASQVNLFQPHLETLLKVVQLDLFGAIDDDLVIHWVTLDEPTQKELSEIRKSDADMDTGYINAGVISPDEARSRLQNDPDSGYDNLTGNAPEPEPDPDMMASMENDNEQADLSRQHELEKIQLNPAPAGPPKNCHTRQSRLLCAAMRPPDLTIGPRENPQTLRWHLFKWRGWQLSLHRWLRSDDDRALHDHSADNVSVLLTGRYVEFVEHRRRVRWPLIPYFRKAETPHRIALLNGPVWSLWLRWPPRREWGFWCPRGWRHWRDYVAERDYSKPDSVSSVGRGCE